MNHVQPPSSGCLARFDFCTQAVFRCGAPIINSLCGPQCAVTGRVPLCGVFVIGVLLAASADSPAVAAAKSTASNVPDFGIGSEMAWHEIGDEFLPPPNGPRPVTNDPRYPYISPA